MVEILVSEGRIMRIIKWRTAWVLAVAAWAVLAHASVFEMPQKFPRHVQLQQQLIQSVRAGRIEEMERVCREGVALLPQDPTWQYNLACALAYRADKAEAFAALERAIELGFRDPAAIRNDDDLKQLAALPQFATLLTKAESLQGKPVDGVPQVSPSVVFMGNRLRSMGPIRCGISRPAVSKRSLRYVMSTSKRSPPMLILTTARHPA